MPRSRAALPEASLTVVGRGPERRRLYRRAEELGIGARVSWRHEWMAARDLERLYEEHDVMLFPSMHEAGGTVVLEAFAKAMPVICLDIGGPGQIVGGIGGDVVLSKSVPIDKIVDGLAEALVRLAFEPEIYRQRSKAAWEDARRRDWWSEVETAYGFLENCRRPIVRSKHRGTSARTLKISMPELAAEQTVRSMSATTCPAGDT